MDWFAPWPDEALKQVAQESLANIPEISRDVINKVCGMLIDITIFLRILNHSPSSFLLSYILISRLPTFAYTCI